LHTFGLSLGLGACLMLAGARILAANEPPPQVSKDGAGSCTV